MASRALFILFVLAPLSSAINAQQIAPGFSPTQLVREVVYNELHDHQQHGYWRYWIERSTPRGVRLEQQVETAAGPITLLEPADGHPLPEQAQQLEQQSFDLLLSSPQEQARHLRQYQQDEDRIGRIVALLPDAFLFDFDSVEDGCYRLRFHPNPAYPAHSVESRILHGMSGTLWVDIQYKRLARLDGRIDHNVDFGFGLLGRVYQGGWFQLQRVRVSPTDWKTAHLEVHMNIRALLVTNIARETSETRGGFSRVPPNLSLAQGVTLIEHTAPPQPVPNSALASAAFSLNR